MANRSPKEMLSASFWCGFWFHMFITQAAMDWHGLNEYVRLVQENWVNTHWIMWISLCVLPIWYHKWQKNSVK